MSRDPEKQQKVEYSSNDLKLEGLEFKMWRVYVIVVELVEVVMVEFGIADEVQVTMGCVLFAK